MRTIVWSSCAIGIIVAGGLVAVAGYAECHPQSAVGRAMSAYRTAVISMSGGLIGQAMRFCPTASPTQCQPEQDCCPGCCEGEGHHGIIMPVIDVESLSQTPATSGPETPSPELTRDAGGIVCPSAVKKVAGPGSSEESGGPLETMPDADGKKEKDQIFSFWMGFFGCWSQPESKDGENERGDPAADYHRQFCPYSGRAPSTAPPPAIVVPPMKERPDTTEYRPSDGKFWRWPF